jgi:hypothetical protein
MLESERASSINKDAAFAVVGAIRTIADTARHVDIRRFILLLRLLEAGSPSLAPVAEPG